MQRDFRFDDLSRKLITEEFVKAAKKGARVNYDPNEEAETFLLLLESYAEAIPGFKDFEAPRQQKRREQLTSIALHLSELSNQLANLDSAALGFLFHHALTIEEKRTGEADHVEAPISLMSMALQLREQALPTLDDFSLGAQLAAKHLPPITFDVCLQVSLAVERLFWEYGLKYSVTETGFAALCLRTVFEAADAPATAIKYWLKMARDSEQSRASMALSLPVNTGN